MNKATEHSNVKLAILKQLNISPRIYDRIMAYGAKGKNAFDVYTLYKSAAKRHPSEIVRIDDKLDMSCLAWMDEGKRMPQGEKAIKKARRHYGDCGLGRPGKASDTLCKATTPQDKDPKALYNLALLIIRSTVGDSCKFRFHHQATKQENGFFEGMNYFKRLA